MGCQLFVIPVRDLGQASSLINFKIGWKTAILFTLVTAKYCPDISLLHINNQHPFLQHHVVIFMASSGKMD